jgi:hypothetical protein
MYCDKSVGLYRQVTRKMVTETCGRGWENELWSNRKSEQENAVFRTAVLFFITEGKLKF